MKSIINEDDLQDCSIGSIPKLIAKYAMPTILSQIVTVIYNLADTYFVGNTNNPAQVAALTISFPLFMSMTLIGNLFGIGANSVISRSLGSKNREKAKEASFFSLYGSMFFTIIWCIILQLFMCPILKVVGALNTETYAAANAYLFWTVVIGGVPSVVSLIFGHLLRGEGNTRSASVGMAVGGIINIILDPIFIQILGLGAKGAGEATFLSNCASLCYMVICFLKNKQSIITLRTSGKRIDWAMAREIILVGLPAAIVVVLGSAANIVLTHLMAPYGDTSVAAFGIVQKIGTITIQITIGLTQGIMPLLGFYYGAKNYQHVRSINRWSFFILLVYSSLCVIVIELIPNKLITLFIQEADTVSMGTIFLRRWILCAFGMCFVMLFNSIFQAMGKWAHSLILTLIRQGILLIPSLIILNRLWGKLGLVWAQPVADTGALIIGIIMYIILEKHAVKDNSISS